MNIKATKIFRFVFNLSMFTLVLMSVTYYAYTNNPTLFGLKNALVPFEGALILSVILSVLLAGINEVVTLLVVKFTKRR